MSITTRDITTLNRRPKRREADVVRACLDYLALRGITAWRNNSGCIMQTHKGKSRPVRFGKVGSSDIRRGGGVAVVVRDVDDLAGIFAGGGK